MVAVKEKELLLQDTEVDDDDQSQDLRYDIAAYPTDFTIKVMYQKWKDGQIIIPDYQRRYVWNLPQASRLIESFLLGLPVPQVFLYRERDSSKLSVIDGQQRLATIVKFYSGKFDETRVFRLSAVDSRWEGKTYEDLSADDSQLLDDRTLRSIIIQQLKPNDNSSVYQIFERLNTGGTQLNPMEIRKALHRKETYDFLEHLNKALAWRDILGLPKPDPRLRDVELVLRVLALAERGDKYVKPMKTFLTDYMEWLEQATPIQLQPLTERFQVACKKVRESLGKRPFHVRPRLNVAVLDAVMASAVKDPERLKPDLRPAFAALKASQKFQDSIDDHTSDADNVEDRLATAQEHLLS